MMHQKIHTTAKTRRVTMLRLNQMASSVTKQKRVLMTLNLIATRKNRILRLQIVPVRSRMGLTLTVQLMRETQVSATLGSAVATRHRGLSPTASTANDHSHPMKIHRT